MRSVCRMLLLFWFTSLCAHVCATGASSSSTGGAEDRAAAVNAQQQQMERNNDERRRQVADAMALLLAAREKVHEAHHKAHQLADPDEHAIITDDVRKRFLKSRHELLLGQASHSTLGMALLGVIVTMPIAIFAIWLRA